MDVRVFSFGVLYPLSLLFGELFCLFLHKLAAATLSWAGLLTTVRDRAVCVSIEHLPLLCLLFVFLTWEPLEGKRLNFMEWWGANERNWEEWCGEICSVQMILCAWGSWWHDSSGALRGQPFLCVRRENYGRCVEDAVMRLMLTLLRERVRRAPGSGPFGFHKWICTAGGADSGAGFHPGRGVEDTRSGRLRAGVALRP